MGKIIWIEGIVGIGKSTFAHILSNVTGITFIQEPVDDNPYLQDFYEDMHRWAFPMQMELLYRRFEQHWYAQSNDGTFVFDRGISGDKVFADMLFDSGHITDREYDTYFMTHKVMVDKLVPPDLIVYLNGTPETAYQRILKRDRDQEATLPLSYLQNMEKYYKPMFLDNRVAFLQTSKLRVLDWNKDSLDDRYLAPIIRSLGIGELND